MKKIIKTIAGFFSRLFEKDITLKIISLCAAIAIWFFVSVTEYPTIDVVIYNVPVAIEMNGTYAEANNFEVTSQSDEFVTVYITGNRGEVGNLSNEELTAVASAENVLSAAEYKLALEIVCSTDAQFSVTKLSTDFVTVKFDQIITKEVPVRPITANLHVASGYICDTDDIVIVPDTIEITGAKDVIDSVTQACINIDADGETNTTIDYTTSEVELYSNGSPLSSDAAITLGKSNFTVHVPILQKQTLPLTVRVINAPESFDTEAFIKKLTLSTEKLEVAAQSENAKDIKSLDIGSIDMREVDIGSVFTFNAEDFLPEGYQNLSGINVVTVTCPSEDLYRVTLSVRGSAINIVNAPAQFDYDIITSGFMPIFIGSQESIDQLSYIDVIAQIDLINYELEEGDYKFPVTFSTPLYDDVWCIVADGTLSSKATVTVKLKSET